MQDLVEGAAALVLDGGQFGRQARGEDGAAHNLDEADVLLLDVEEPLGHMEKPEGALRRRAVVAQHEIHHVVAALAPQDGIRRVVLDETRGSALEARGAPEALPRHALSGAAASQSRAAVRRAEKARMPHSSKLKGRQASRTRQAASARAERSRLRRRTTDAGQRTIPAFTPSKPSMENARAIGASISGKRWLPPWKWSWPRREPPTMGKSALDPMNHCG